MKDLLSAYLSAQRTHVAATLGGLSDAAGHRGVLPSGWTMVGMVQHLALDVERFWFRWVMAGEDVSLCSGDEAWRVDAGASIADVLAAYRAECEAADQVIARLAIDAPVAQWPADWGPCHVENLADALLHVIAETATHAGHLDAARELIDGTQRLVLT